VGCLRSSPVMHRRQHAEGEEMRSDGRKAADIRPVRITTEFPKHADGSVLIEMGQTRVICTATVEEQVPAFLRETSRGLGDGGVRHAARLQRYPHSARIDPRPGGRPYPRKIQRLIGRSLRAVTNLEVVGPRTLWIDCDVIEADGGHPHRVDHRGVVALALAFRRLRAPARSAPIRSPARSPR